MVAREEEDISERRRLVTKKRPKREKVAKAEKRARAERDMEYDAFKDAIYSLSDKFAEAISATIAAANVRREESCIHGERDYQLEKMLMNSKRSASSSMTMTRTARCT